MAKRKKLAEMTPIERMNKLMKGLSWEEAEEVGVEILARTFAFHAYSVKDGEKFFENLMEKIALRADEWAHSDDGCFVLSMARAAHIRGMEEKE